MICSFVFVCVDDCLLAKTKKRRAFEFCAGFACFAFAAYPVDACKRWEGCSAKLEVAVAMDTEGLPDLRQCREPHSLELGRVLDDDGAADLPKSSKLNCLEVGGTINADRTRDLCANAQTAHVHTQMHNGTHAYADTNKKINNQMEK